MKIIITSIESNPPPKLSKPAVAPLVKKIKNDLKSARQKAYFIFMKKSEYITTIFESPIFTPGGKNGNGGKKLSTTERTIVKESISPLRAIFFVFIKSPMTYFTVNKFLYYGIIVFNVFICGNNFY